MNPGTTEVMPGLAERWEISADGLLWSINRINDKSHPAHAVSKRVCGFVATPFGGSDFRFVQVD